MTRCSACGRLCKNGFEKLPLGVIQDKGTGTVKKLFVDDVDSLEVLLAHSMPEGIANLMVPHCSLCGNVLCRLEAGTVIFGIHSA